MLGPKSKLKHYIHIVASRCSLQASFQQYYKMCCNWSVKIPYNHRFFIQILTDKHCLQTWTLMFPCRGFHRYLCTSTSPDTEVLGACRQHFNIQRPTFSQTPETKVPEAYNSRCVKTQVLDFFIKKLPLDQGCQTYSLWPKPTPQRVYSGPWDEYVKCKKKNEDMNSRGCQNHFSSADICRPSQL